MIVVTRAQALEGGFLVTKGGQQGERKLGPVEGLKSKVGYGLFDLYDIHAEAGDGFCCRGDSRRPYYWAAEGVTGKGNGANRLKRSRMGFPAAALIVGKV